MTDPHAPPARRLPHPSSTTADPRHDASGRNELIALLGRRFRGASFTLEFDLRTTLARQLFQRDFNYVSRQLHALEASRRVRGLDRQVLSDAIAHIVQHADLVRVELRQCAAEFRAAIEADAATRTLAAPGFDDGQATRLQATIVSPHARTYLELLRLADDAVVQVERAWLLGLVEPAVRARRNGDCRRHLLAFKEVVREQRHAVGQRVREFNACQAQAAPADGDDATACVPPTALDASH